MEQWEKQQTGTDKPLFPNREELQKSLKPPAPDPKRPPKNKILRMQLLLCVLVLGGLLLGRRMELPFYQKCRTAFETAMEQGVEFSDREELIRFTNGVLEQAEKAVEQLQPQPLTGAGGWTPSRWPKTPEGYSLEELELPISLQLPVEEFWVSSHYGWREHPVTQKKDFHTGLDLAAMEGTAIHPAADGIVVKTARGRSYGNYVTVLHSDGVATKYCHMQYVFVRPGEVVTGTDVLGTVGSTGMVTGPHLHLELLYNDIGHAPEPALGLS